MPLVRNTSKSPQCISDLNVTWSGTEDGLGQDVMHLSDEQIANSMGVQMKLAQGTFVVLGEEDVKAEAERRVALQAERVEQVTAPVVEEQSEVVRAATWGDGSEQVEDFAGGVALPSDRAEDRGEAPVNVNLNNVESDPSQAVPDIGQEG